MNYRFYNFKNIHYCLQVGLVSPMNGRASDIECGHHCFAIGLSKVSILNKFGDVVLKRSLVSTLINNRSFQRCPSTHRNQSIRTAVTGLTNAAQRNVFSIGASNPVGRDFRSILGAGTLDN